MTEKIIIAGAGGQGVMLLGKVLAEAALRENREVTWFPCYGAEVRGGTAYCMVVISDAAIASPYIEKADTLIIMNEPSMIKFGERITPRGFVLANSSLIDSQALTRHARGTVRAFQFTDIAAGLGNIKVANMVALGSLIAQKKLVKPQTIRSVMVAMAPRGREDLVAINEKALEAGLQLK